MGEARWSERGMYGGLAPWWPLISPVEEYREEAAFIAGLLLAHDPPVRHVLELGSGGGHLARHLRERFAMTLVDLSPRMLEQSRRLNPECEHLQGDMRTTRLQRVFDAVLIHDAIAYMLTSEELRMAADTAFAHCAPGGLAVFVPDDTLETFRPGTDHGGRDGPDGRGVRYLEWQWDPDPADTTAEALFVFAVRSPDGTVEIVGDHHRWGIFTREVWLDTLEDAGFRVGSVIEQTTEDRPPRELFLGRRP